MCVHTTSLKRWHLKKSIFEFYPVENVLFQAQKVQPEWCLNQCLEIYRDQAGHISLDSFKVLRVSVEEAQLACRVRYVSEGSQNSIPPATFRNLPPPTRHLAPVQRLQRSQPLRPQRPSVWWKHCSAPLGVFEDLPLHPDSSAVTKAASADRYVAPGGFYPPVNRAKQVKTSSQLCFFHFLPALVSLIVQVN